MVQSFNDKILSLFVNDYSLKFGVIEKKLGIRSNKLAYYLKGLVNNKVLVKDGDYYFLSKDYEKNIPFLSSSGSYPLPVVLVCVNNKDGEFLLVKRNKRPYKDYWCMLGGKILFDETIADSAKRIVLEKSGIKGKFLVVSDVAHERVLEEDRVKHGFILFFTKFSCKSKDFFSVSGEELKWFTHKDVIRYKKRIVPSDFYFLTNKINSRLDVKTLNMTDDGGRLRLK